MLFCAPLACCARRQLHAPCDPLSYAAANLPFVEVQININQTALDLQK